MPEPRPTEEPKSFEELASDQILNLFFIRVLLKRNLTSLTQFLDEKRGQSHLDPLEIPALRRILTDPITGPIAEVRAWNFKDKPYMFAFRGWRVGQFPKPDIKSMLDTYKNVYDAFLENDRTGSGTVSIDQLRVLLDQLHSIYDVVGAEINPDLKKIWLENNIKQYEPWEGKTEGLPGRLTVATVNRYLAELRTYRNKLNSEPEAMVGQTATTPPTLN
jgi:hypothetical protein